MPNRKKGRNPGLEEEDEFDSKPDMKQNDTGDLDSDGDETLNFASIADSVTPRDGESDSREIDSLTDRIFGSVLSRYGWERHGNRIEHVGEERQRR
jgi:hypothetical protein